MADTVTVNPFAENTTRRGYKWNCRVLADLGGGRLIVEPIECDGADEFIAVAGEYAKH